MIVWYRDGNYLRTVGTKILADKIVKKDKVYEVWFGGQLVAKLDRLSSFIEAKGETIKYARSGQEMLPIIGD